MKDYYGKMRIIELIRAIVKKEKLDPTYKSDFHTLDESINKEIKENMQKFIVV
jgi:hypothetical protein